MSNGSTRNHGERKSCRNGERAEPLVLPPDALGIETAERQLDGALIRGRPTFHDRPIGFGDPAMLEQKPKRGRCLAVSPQNEAAGGVLIQPMGEHRRGVPQDRHAHGLLPSGLNALEDLFPGLTREALDAGALRIDRMRDSRFYFEGGEHARFESGYTPHPGEPGRERWLGYAANRTAHARLLEHPGAPRPWLVCIPGYRVGQVAVDFTGFRTRWLHRTLGLNVAVPVMPLHGPRRAGRQDEGH